MTLSRDIRLDWVDLGLLNEIVIVGDDGQVVYEGYVNGTPRTFDSAGQQSFTINCVGHMGQAQDVIFSERYVDCRFDQWGPPSVQRRSNLVTIGSPPTGDAQPNQDTTTGTPALAQTLVGAWPVGAINEALYDAGSGVALESLYYAFKVNANVNVGDTNWQWLTRLFTEDTLVNGDTSVNLRAASGTGTLSATAPTRRFAVVQLNWAANAGGAGTEYTVFWTCLATYGTTLTKRTAGDATNAPALWLSDILKDIAQRFCPQLDLSGVQQNQTLIYQSAYDDSTPFDAWQELNSFALWELGVWEEKKLVYEPADLTDYDWEVRLSDPGVSTNLQGIDATELRNGIYVVYEDAATGNRLRLSPADFAQLRDDSPDNPANLWGRKKWGPEPYEVPVPCTQAMALNFGQAKLVELNTPKELGQITVTGYVRNRAGQWRPAKEMRASQTVAITDFPNSRPRLIGETSYDDDSRRMDISTDGPAQTLEAFFDRLASRRTARNLLSAP